MDKSSQPKELDSYTLESCLCDVRRTLCTSMYENKCQKERLSKRLRPARVL